jgi:hypothetical protein
VEKYKMSFSTGGLFSRESVTLSMIFLEIGDWDTVRDKVLTENLLQTRTLTSAQRVCREVISRLKTLNPSELDLLVRGTSQEQGYLLWIAVCRCYKFVADFAVEILRERYLGLKIDLHHEDFDSFFNKKSEWHIELDNIRLVTRNKLRQVLFRILREAELLTVNNTINAAMLSPRLLEAIPRGSRQDVLFFPMFESELEGRKE